MDVNAIPMATEAPTEQSPVSIVLTRTDQVLKNLEEVIDAMETQLGLALRPVAKDPEPPETTEALRSPLIVALVEHMVRCDHAATRIQSIMERCEL